MRTLDSLALQRTLGVFLARLEQQPGLRAEMARARREFFGVEPPDRDPLRQAAADARFTEWYLLERDSEVLGEVPVRCLARAMREPQPGQEMLLASAVSVYLVEKGGEVVQLRDMQDGQIREMERPPMLDLSPGDVLVGRMFADDRGYWVPSTAVAVQHEARSLARAFQRDLTSLNLDRRLTQAELEHLLFRHWRLVAQAREDHMPLERLEAELDRMLSDAGESELSAQEVSTALRESEHPGQVMGPVMDEVAFETDIDLERLRLLLVEIWNAHHAGGVPPVEAAIAMPGDDLSNGVGSKASEVGGESLGERLAREDRGRTE